MVMVKLKLLHEFAQVPAYQSNWAAGADLFAIEDKEVTRNKATKFRTGLMLEIPKGFEAQVRGRSSLAARGVHCFLGTIDSDYRGELHVPLIMLGWGFYHVKPGDRIAQLVIAPCARGTFEKVDELTPSVRGAGGFGSTGRR